jgi:hypothetical protein
MRPNCGSSGFTEEAGRFPAYFMNGYTTIDAQCGSRIPLAGLGYTLSHWDAQVHKIFSFHRTYQPLDLMPQS